MVMFIFVVLVIVIRCSIVLVEFFRIVIKVIVFLKDFCVRIFNGLMFFFNKFNRVGLIFR